MIKTYENVNISAEYQQFCTKPSEQDSFFRASRNESISAEYQQLCTKPSEQGLFSELVETSPRSGMLRSKLTKM